MGDKRPYKKVDDEPDATGADDAEQDAHPLYRKDGSIPEGFDTKQLKPQPEEEVTPTEEKIVQKMGDKQPYEKVDDTKDVEDAGPWQGPDVGPADESVEADDTDIGAFDPPSPAEVGSEKSDEAQGELESAQGDTVKDVEQKLDSAADVNADAGKAPSGGENINADPNAKGRSAEELGTQTPGGGDGSKTVAVAPPTRAPVRKIAGGALNVKEPPKLPEQKEWKDKAKAGMAMPRVPVKALEDQAGGGGEPELEGGSGPTQDQEPQKSPGQVAAEAEQVGAEGKRKLAIAEKDLQDEAKAEADAKEKTAEAEKDKKEAEEKAKGDGEIAAKEAEGKSERQQAEAEGEQKKQQAQAEGEQRKAAAKAEGEQKKAAAESEREQKIDTENQRQETEIATARSEAEAEEQKLRDKGRREQSQLEQQKAQKDQAARSKGDQDEATANRELEAEKSRIRAEGQSRANAAQQRGERDAQSEIRRGEAQARSKRAAGLRRKRQLEREAERKKADQGWLERAWNSVKSAVSSLYNRAKDAWNSAKRLATQALNWAKQKARQIRDRARQAIQAAYRWADNATGGAISRAANKLRQIRDAVRSKLQEAASWLSEKVNALKEKVTNWVTERWNAFKDACNRIKESVTSAINAAKAWCQQKIAEARAWVNEKIEAAKKWVSDKINAAVAWVEQKYNEIAAKVRAAVDTIVNAVKAAVKAVWDHYAKILKEIGTWLAEAWDKFSKWAQEAFVKFWNGPWRDVLIGVAVAVLIAAVTVATGGVGLVAIVAISAAATGAARMGGEVLARRAAVAIKNDPERADRFQKEMDELGDDAQRWYKGVKKDEGWGDTLKAGAVEGARGAAEGAVSGLMGGAGGAIATRAAAGIAKAGAKEGAKFLAKRGVQKGAEWGTRMAVDAGLSFAGDMATGTVNAELDIMTGKRTREEAYQFHVDRHLKPGAIGARLVGSSVTGTLRMGSHKGPTTSVQDGLVRKLVGEGAEGATATVRQKVTRHVVDSSISGMENGIQGGLTSVANGGKFMDGFGPGFAGGMSGHAGRLAGERYGRRFSAPQVDTDAPKPKTKNPGNDNDAPEMNPKLRTDLDDDPTLLVKSGDADDGSGGTTPMRIDDDAPTVKTKPADGVEVDPSVVPRRQKIQEGQAARLNKMRGKVEGFGHNVEVVPDHHPKAGQPGFMTVTEARRYVKTVSAMRKNPTGQEALQRIKDNGLEVTMERGQGSFQEGKRINIDPEIRGRHNRAGVMSHEAHHGATKREMPDPHRTDRGGYVDGMLRNEAEAQAKLFEYHKAQNTDSSREFGHGAYKKAYSDAEANFRKQNPTASDAEVRAHAVEAGTQALKKEFGNAVPSTSMTKDPVTGQPVLKPGAPENYEQLYGRWHDDNSMMGKKASEADTVIMDPSQQGPKHRQLGPNDTQPMQKVDSDQAQTPLPFTKRKAQNLVDDSEGRPHRWFAPGPRATASPRRRRTRSTAAGATRSRICGTSTTRTRPRSTRCPRTRRCSFAISRRTGRGRGTIRSGPTRRSRSASTRSTSRCGRSRTARCTWCITTRCWIRS